MTGLRIRQAARAIVLDDSDRVLLVEFAFPPSIDAPGDEPRHHVWATPGGGIEPGEDSHCTLRRELHEELGLTDVAVGPEVWHRTFHFPFLDGSADGQHDRFFVVRTPAFSPHPAIGWDRLRTEYVVDLRWWTLAELAASPARFAPSQLPALLEALVTDGVPPSPVDVGT